MATSSPGVNPPFEAWKNREVSEVFYTCRLPALSCFKFILTLYNTYLLAAYGSRDFRTCRFLAPGGCKDFRHTAIEHLTHWAA
jgi:hypothetical protein